MPFKHKIRRDKLYSLEYSIYYICPRCEVPMDNETVRFCSSCGQRLGAKSKAKLLNKHN